MFTPPINDNNEGQKIAQTNYIIKFIRPHNTPQKLSVTTPLRCRNDKGIQHWHLAVQVNKILQHITKLNSI